MKNIKNIKTISLLQPWASLILLGHKKIETRSWASLYRGPLAIHASASADKGLMALLEKDEVFQAGLEMALGEERAFDLAALPRGCVLGIVYLEDVLRIPVNKTTYQSKAARSANFRRGVTLPPAMPELAFGDFSPGRFAWILGRPHIFETPIPAKGALAVWEWEYSRYPEAVNVMEEFGG